MSKTTLTALLITASPLPKSVEARLANIVRSKMALVNQESSEACVPELITLFELDISKFFKTLKEKNRDGKEFEPDFIVLVDPEQIGKSTPDCPVVAIYHLDWMDEMDEIDDLFSLDSENDSIKDREIYHDESESYSEEERHEILYKDLATLLDAALLSL